MPRLGLVLCRGPSSLGEVVRRPGRPHFVQLYSLVFRRNSSLDLVSINSVVAGAGHRRRRGAALCLVAASARWRLRRTGCNQRSAACGPGLARLRRDASTARGSPGRSAAVARGRRCLWSQMGARRCPAAINARRRLVALASPRRPPRGAKRHPRRVVTLVGKNSQRLGDALSKASALSACKRLRTIKKDSQAAARRLAHGGGRARAKQRLGQPPDLK